jgi:hypothetical protein
MRKLTGLIIGFILGFSQIGFAAADSATCAKLVKNLSTSQDIDLMVDCMDHLFFNNGEDSPPASFNNVIAIGYRVIALSPQSEPTYINVAWLLYSKWVTWSHHPEQMPDGALKMQESLSLLEKGAQVFSSSAAYFQDAGSLLNPAAWYESAALAAPCEKYLIRADQLSTDPKQKTRIRLDMGHLLRHLNDIPNALI